MTYLCGFVLSMNIELHGMKFSSFKVEFFNLGGVKILSEVNFMYTLHVHSLSIILLNALCVIRCSDAGIKAVLRLVHNKLKPKKITYGYNYQNSVFIH